MTRLGFRHLFLTLAAVAPAVAISCGGGDERTFVEPDAAATGGSAGASGSAGSAGVAGSGGTAGDAGTPCKDAKECDDGDPCNGTETCSGVCQAGTPMKDGEVCKPPDDAGLGSVCFQGVCSPSCKEDKDCSDNDVCTGTETCNPTAKVCQVGTPLSCDDNDDCTENSCDAEKGCFYPLIDKDGDGHASTTLGSCGDDCDDNDKTVFTGAAELCDGKDNNCNGHQNDELASTWYADCDNDGFAAIGAPSAVLCNKPAAPHSSCNSKSGGWTTQAPTPGNTDCWDKDADAHPYTAANEIKAYQNHAITGAPTLVDFDYNCDKKEERRYTNGGVDPNNSLCLSFNGACLGPSGYISSLIPVCGKGGSYTTCGKGIIFGTCLRTTSNKIQECR